MAGLGVKALKRTRADPPPRRPDLKKRTTRTPYVSPLPGRRHAAVNMSVL